ncbi:hypothetical protein M3Y98_00956100 [Aphelenchoides besseyi]|nr:hypothetical protein M3Y98_00956100 [Aphelenchoides besseyi]
MNQRNTELNSPITEGSSFPEILYTHRHHLEILGLKYRDFVAVNDYRLVVCCPRNTYKIVNSIVILDAYAFSPRMVCVPCIILPILVVIYVRFIQPLILRFVPDRWKARIDSVLYPTCPVNLRDRPRAKKNTTEATAADPNSTPIADETCACPVANAETKKDN